MPMPTAVAIQCVEGDDAEGAGDLGPGVVNGWD
jgi:hypothetical protein